MLYYSYETLSTDLEQKIVPTLFKGKMVVILGPRQSGKTTLSKKIIASHGSRAEYYNCQLADVRSYPRNEIKKGFKVYFLDIGVRNALVDIVSPMATRNDRGAIFENFFVSERMKHGSLEIFPPELMFWRTRTGQEVDIIEKSGQTISAFECKWKDVAQAPTSFTRAYPSATFSSVNVGTIAKNH